MSSSFSQQYWEELRTTWSDSFVTETIQRFNEPAYVYKLASAVGQDLTVWQNVVQTLQKNKTGSLGWLLFDRMWQKKFSLVQEVKEDLTFDIPVAPIIGTLPTGRINAVALAIPNQSQHILAFELGMIPLVTYLSDYLAIHMNPSTSKGGHQTFDILQSVNSSYVATLTSMMGAYFKSGIPLAKTYIPIENPAQKNLRNGFRNMMELFVTGHEYGHVGLGHLDRGKSKVFSLAGQSQCHLSFPTHMKDEFEADQVGFLITLVSYLKKGLPYYFTAAVIVYFLEFCKNIYRGLSFIIQKEVSIPSHPPFSERVSHLESVLFQLISDQDREYYYGLTKFYQRLLAHFEQEFFKQLKYTRSDIELAPIWATLQT